MRVFVTKVKKENGGYRYNYMAEKPQSGWIENGVGGVGYDDDESIRRSLSHDFSEVIINTESFPA